MTSSWLISGHQTWWALVPYDVWQKIRSVLVPLLALTLQGDGIRPCAFTSTLHINSSCNQYSVIRYWDPWWTAAVISCLRGCGVGPPHKHSTQKCSKSISLLWVYVVEMCKPDTCSISITYRGLCGRDAKTSVSPVASCSSSGGTPRRPNQQRDVICFLSSEFFSEKQEFTFLRSHFFFCSRMQLNNFNL